MGILRHFVLFLLGGSGYVGLELVWRGRSHGSMFFTGGLCFLLLGQANRRLPAGKKPLRGFVGAGIITLAELCAGLLCNRRYQVWDYRQLPLNFRGQICLPFCLLWALLSLPAMRLYALAERLINAFPGLPRGRK